MPQITASRIEKHLIKLGNPEIAAHSQRFFKTGKGEYGEGDRFLGIRVPVLRKEAKAWWDVPLTIVFQLVKSPWHEVRLAALILLVTKFQKAKNESEKQSIFQGYLKRTKYINNWDLVDTSASHIVGAWLFSRDRKILYRLAKSKDLWERRIAIIATHFFIRNSDFNDTLALAKNLLQDKEDLIHKAVGWMLREAGNRDREVEIQFLDEYAPVMPRTMLRYAIEKFPEGERKEYLAKGSEV